MNRKLFFEDGSVIEVVITVAEEGKMAKVALQKLTEFLDDDMLDDPRLALQEEEADLDLDEEELDDELIDDLEDEEWLDEEEIEDDWGEEDEEELVEAWDNEDEYR